MTPAGLSCRGLRVAPGGVGVLDDCGLEVAAGTRSVLVGPSGAGKTTLLRTIAGLQRAESGTVTLDGRRLDAVPAHRRGVAVVFQEPRLLEHLSVADNVALGLRAAGIARAERRSRARAMLAELGLDGLGERRVRGLSGGEQQRVALARALLVDPALLLLDEPLAALDPDRRQALRTLLIAVQRERALTTLIVTHDRGEAAELGERIGVMLGGRIVQHDVPQALFERPVSADVARFFGTANLLRHGGQLVAIRPEHVVVGAGGDRRGTVIESVYGGDHVRLVIASEGVSIDARVGPAAAPGAGAHVTFALPPQRLWPLPDPAPPSHEETP